MAPTECEATARQRWLAAAVVGTAAAAHCNTAAEVSTAAAVRATAAAAGGDVLTTECCVGACSM